MMAVLAVAASAVLLDFRRIAVAPVGRVEVKIHQLGAIQSSVSPPKNAAQHTGKARNYFHTNLFIDIIEEDLK